MKKWLWNLLACMTFVFFYMISIAILGVDESKVKSFDGLIAYIIIFIGAEIYSEIIRKKC